MAKTVVDGFKTNLKLKTRYPMLKFDSLRMYFGKPYVIDLEGVDGQITVRVPTLGEIINIGEDRFYGTLNVFTTNTTQNRLMLSKANPPIDWNELSDFDLFTSLYVSADDEVVDCLFDGLDLKGFGVYLKDQNEKILYNKKTKTEINEAVYQHIAQYLRLVFRLHVEEKITRDPILKQMYLQKDEFALQHASKKKTEESNSIQPLISACVNHPGFKYKLNELEQVNICEFYDSVSRLQVYENTTALLRGSYLGMIDTSKIDKESFNFMRKI